jgi:hypothetical protein
MAPAMSADVSAVRPLGNGAEVVRSATNRSSTSDCNTSVASASRPYAAAYRSSLSRRTSKLNGFRR